MQSSRLKFVQPDKKINPALQLKATELSFKRIINKKICFYLKNIFYSASFLSLVLTKLVSGVALILYRQVFCGTIFRFVVGAYYDRFQLGFIVLLVFKFY